MANKKISEFPTITDIDGTEFVPIVKAGANVKATIANATKLSTLQKAYDNSTEAKITLAADKPLIVYDTNGTTVKEIIGFPLVQASTATLTPNLSLYNEFELTAQSGALLIANPNGVISNFSSFIVRVTGSGTITYDTQFRAFGSALQTTLTAGKTLYIICFRNSTDNVYDTVTREEV